MKSSPRSLISAFVFSIHPSPAHIPSQSMSFHTTYHPSFNILFSLYRISLRNSEVCIPMFEILPPLAPTTTTTTTASKVDRLFSSAVPQISRQTNISSPMLFAIGTCNCREYYRKAFWNVLLGLYSATRSPPTSARRKSDPAQVTVLYKTAKVFHNLIIPCSGSLFGFRKAIITDLRRLTL